MNITEIAAVIKKSNRTISAPQCKQIVSDVFNALKADLANDESTTIVGFGTFKPVTRTARTGRNPQTGESLQIPTSKSVAFKVSKVFKDSLN